MRSCRCDAEGESRETTDFADCLCSCLRRRQPLRGLPGQRAENQRTRVVIDAVTENRLCIVKKCTSDLGRRRAKNGGDDQRDDQGHPPAQQDSPHVANGACLASEISNPIVSRQRESSSRHDTHANATSYPMRHPPASESTRRPFGDHRDAMHPVTLRPVLRGLIATIRKLRPHDARRNVNSSALRSSGTPRSQAGHRSSRLRSGRLGGDRRAADGSRSSTCA